MSRMPISLICAAAIAAANLALGGCDRGPPSGAVNGEVTLDGQPVKNGRILFTPIDRQTQPAGGTISDGKFTVSDVPVAKMRVEINGNKVIGKRRVYEDSPNSPIVEEVAELVPRKYNINSELTLDVKEGSQTVQYDLKSK
jgi:hypothetical protein